jgi:hypothetical protein
MTGIEVNLTNTELMSAAMTGVIRQVASLRDGRKPGFGCADDNNWQIHIEGACGEMAVAKALGIYADLRVDSFKAPDLPGIQVRTRSKHAYELIVRKNDSDNDLFILVTGVNGKYWVRGWIRACDCKKPDWLQSHANREPAYFVPHSELLTMETLKMAVA